MKRFILIIILIVIVVSCIFVFKNYKHNSRPDVKIPILLYHDCVSTVPDIATNNDPDSYNYINTPESFEENIKTLIENGYTIISMSELHDALSGKALIPDKPILINFDDGYYSNYEFIFPILKKYNAKASIFIVTDNVGKEIDGVKYLGWNECLEMQNSGLVEIFSHSKRHVFYNRVPISVF